MAGEKMINCHSYSEIHSLINNKNYIVSWIFLGYRTSKWKSKVSGLAKTGVDIRTRFESTHS